MKNKFYFLKTLTIIILFFGQTHNIIAQVNDISKCHIETINDIEYNGKQHKIIPKIYNGSIELNIGVDCNISLNSKSYSDVGNIYVTYTGIGDYFGTITTSYRITPLDISKESITYNINNVIYNTHEQKQNPTIYFEGKLIKSNIDYTIEYKESDYKNCGTKKLTIRGLGNFTNEKTIEYYCCPIKL